MNDDEMTRMYRDVEDLLCRYEREPELGSVRKRARQWVDQFLLRQCAKRNPVLFRILSEGIGAVCPDEISAQMDCMSFSARTKAEYRRLKKTQNEAAVQDFLIEQILKKERETLREKSGLPYRTWKRFEESNTCLSLSVIDRICEGLGLNTEEDAILRSLFIRDTFEVKEPLKIEVHMQIRKRKEQITDFQIRNEISPGAWVPYQAASENRFTSQETLLKMVIGFEFDRQDGKRFLAVPGSGFFMKRDMLVLACLELCIYDHERIYDILEEFAKDGSLRLYANLYTKR